MADYIRNSGTFTVTKLGSVSKYDGDMTITITKVGINATGDTKNIDSASWQALATSSLSDMRYAYFKNISSSVIQVARDATGTNIITTLQPYDVSIIAMTGSIEGVPLYARSLVSSSVLDYIVTEA